VAKKKVVSEVDKEIVRELKNNRIFSKTQSGDISELSSDDLFEYLTGVVNSLTDDEVIIYICDKMYMDGDINLLLHVSDTYGIIVNDSVIYKRLQDHTFDLNKAILKFYDRNLTERTD
jgi:hypothetical protein